MVVAGVIVGAVGLVTWERSKWLRERDAQCASARALIAAATQKDRVIDTLGKPSTEYGRTDWSEIERHFAGTRQDDKLADIRERLHHQGRLLVYSRSNSIMFLYLNSQGRASHASCFLQ
jgi:hypothetical protein